MSNVEMMTNPYPQDYKIQREWESFVAAAYPAPKNTLDPTSIQYVEMRRAFYAGYRSFLSLMMVVLTPGEEATPMSEWMLDNIDKELDEFMADMLSGLR